MTQVEQRESPAEIELSVVICTRDRRESLLLTLDSVLSQRTDGPVEVLVVDNGSSDGSGAAVRELRAGSPLPLRLAEEPEQGLSIARNRALREATGRALVFIDDDVTCHAGWLLAHLRSFRDPQVVGVAGRILPRLPAEAPGWWHELLPDEKGGPTSRYDFGDQPAEVLPGAGIPLPFGANMGVLREAALEVGGFRSDLGWGRKMIPSEELEFFRRIRARGGRIVYVPAASLDHRIDPGRTSREYYLRWQRAYGRSTVILQRAAGRLHYGPALVEAVREAIRWSREARRVGRRDDVLGELRAAKERERMKGRLLQLLGC